MLIGAIVVGLILGLIAGGNIWNLGSVRLLRVPLLIGAVAVRYGTEAAIGAGIGLADDLRLPLFALAYGMLLFGLWANRTQPGLSLAFVGILSNDFVILVNGGHMPIWQPSLSAAGLTPDQVRTTFHTILPPDLDANFLLHAGPLADIIPIPLPYIRNVASLGDLFLSAGLAFFLFATVVRSPQELDEAEMELVRRRLEGITGTPRPATTTPAAIRGETSITPGMAEAATLQRPAAFGGATSPTGCGSAGAPGPRRPRPSAPLRPACPQRLVLRPLGGPAHQPVRRPDPPDRVDLPRPQPDQLAHRGRRHFHRRDAAQPGRRPNRGNVRGSLGPP